MAKRIVLTPMPTMMFHLPHPETSPVRWVKDYKRARDGMAINWPSCEQRRWKPSYWLLWLRVWFESSVDIGIIEPTTQQRYVARFESEEESE